MQIIVDSGDSIENMKLAVSVLAHWIGEDNLEAAAAHEDAAPAASAAAPPPPSNVLPFPAPPPPPPAPIAETGAATTSETAASSSVAASGAPTSTGGAPPAAPALAPLPGAAISLSELDSAGLPWDARIHQKAKSRKKDGTWKLQKNIDQTLVQSVVSELLAHKKAAAAVPAAVSLPLPVPAVPPAAAAAPVPAPPIAGAVPVPPAPAIGGVSSLVTFRSLVDKIVVGTKSGGLTATRVQEICQKHGAPNLASLNTMPALIPLVDTDIDVALLDVQV